METLALDYIPWGLEAPWPTRRWAEPVHGRRGDSPRGVRLGHVSDSAMVMVSTFPRARFDAEVGGRSQDAVREIAYETTFTLVNLALHQIRVPGERPEGLIGSLVQFASQQADRHREWAAAHWGPEAASITGMAGWQSGFSLAYPDAYVIVHACGIAIDQIRLLAVDDLSDYEISTDPLELNAMLWELWRSQPAAGYEDLARVLVAR